MTLSLRQFTHRLLKGQSPVGACLPQVTTANSTLQTGPFSAPSKILQASNKILATVTKSLGSYKTSNKKAFFGPAKRQKAGLCYLSGL